MLIKLRRAFFSFLIYVQMFLFLSFRDSGQEKETRGSGREKVKQRLVRERESEKASRDSSRVNVHKICYK